MILYLDTSALVKRYVRETGSAEVAALIEVAEMTGAVVLTRVEMPATLSKAVRQNWVAADKATQAWKDFLAPLALIHAPGHHPCDFRPRLSVGVGIRITRLRCDAFCLGVDLAGNTGNSGEIGDF